MARAPATDARPQLHRKPAMPSSPRLLFLAIVGLAALAEAGLTAAPRAISPQGPGIASVHTVCPTFSWTGVDGALGYEVLIHDLPRTDSDEATGIGSRPTTLVLQHSLPGGALSWTPSANECLKTFGRYSWTVRALGASTPSAWSEPQAFEIQMEPLFEEITAVLDVALARYVDRRETVPSHHQRVFAADDVELRLTETGSAQADYVQLVFDTPAATGSAAWSWLVSGDDGGSFLSTPSAADAVQFSTDGQTLVGALRDLRLAPTNAPSSCDALREGWLYFDAGLAELCVCDGSAPWAPVDGTGTC